MPFKEAWCVFRLAPAPTALCACDTAKGRHDQVFNTRRHILPSAPRTHGPCIPLRYRQPAVQGRHAAAGADHAPAAGGGNGFCEAVNMGTHERVVGSTNFTLPAERCHTCCMLRHASYVQSMCKPACGAEMIPWAEGFFTSQHPPKKLCLLCRRPV